MKLYTHINVDLDAVFSVIVEAQQNNIPLDEEHLEFVHADVDVVPEGCLAVDIAARKHGDGDSYVGGFLSDLLPEEVVLEVNEHDSRGFCTPRVPLATLISAVKRSGLSDMEIVRLFQPIVEGLMKHKEERKYADAYLATLETVEIGGYRFLVQDKDIPCHISKHASERGVVGTVYWSSNGCGIARFPGEDVPDLSVLSLPNWYTDHRKFLFCYGSHKAPKDPARSGFRDITELINWLQKNL